MQQRQNLQLTLSSLQSQKQQETTALQTLQSSKLSVAHVHHPTIDFGGARVSSTGYHFAAYITSSSAE